MEVKDVLLKGAKIPDLYNEQMFLRLSSKDIYCEITGVQHRTTNIMSFIKSVYRSQTFTLEFRTINSLTSAKGMGVKVASEKFIVTLLTRAKLEGAEFILHC